MSDEVPPNRKIAQRLPFRQSFLKPVFPDLPDSRGNRFPDHVKRDGLRHSNQLNSRRIAPHPFSRTVDSVEYLEAIRTDIHAGWNQPGYFTFRSFTGFDDCPSPATTVSFSTIDARVPLDFFVSFRL